MKKDSKKKKWRYTNRFLVVNQNESWVLCVYPVVWCWESATSSPLRNCFFIERQYWWTMSDVLSNAPWFVCVCCDVQYMPVRGCLCSRAYLMCLFVWLRECMRMFACVFECVCLSDYLNVCLCLCIWVSSIVWLRKRVPLFACVFVYVCLIAWTCCECIFPCVTVTVGKIVTVRENHNKQGKLWRGCVPEESNVFCCFSWCKGKNRNKRVFIFLFFSQ